MWLCNLHLDGERETAQDHLLHQWEEKSCPVWSSGIELSASTLFSEKAFYSMMSWQTCFWIFTSIFLQPKNTRHMILTWSNLKGTSSFNLAGWFSHLARLPITPGFECEVGFYARGSQVLWHTMQSKRPKKMKNLARKSNLHRCVFLQSHLIVGLYCILLQFSIKIHMKSILEWHTYHF